MKKILTLIIFFISFTLFNNNIVFSANECFLDWVSVADWESRVFFKTELSTNCNNQKQERNCENWGLDWNSTYTFSTCDAPSNCKLDWAIIAHWNSIYAFKHRYSEDCNKNKKTRTCNNWKLLWDNDYDYASCNMVSNLEWDNVETWISKGPNWIDNQHLDKLKWNNDINPWNDWEKSIKELLYIAAKDLKVIFYFIAWIYFLILVIRILTKTNTEEEIGNFKKWILWISVWIIITQVSYYFVNVLYDQEVWWELANNFTDDIIEPIILILETATSFFFMLTAIVWYYYLITANWNEEQVEKWKKSFIYAIIWFVLVKVARILIMTTYWKIDCNYSWVLSIFGWTCSAESDLSELSQLIVEIINWVNGFVWIIVVLMIVYAWILVLFSGWDEDKLNKAKDILKYIFIWLLVIVFSYLILTFFIIPENDF